jgi:GT2 family glycosyltransferase
VNTDLSIVIAQWNRCDELRRLLLDLGAQTHPAAEIIVVDNASTDGSIDMLEREFPAVHLIRLATNAGYQHARNVAINAAGSELIVSLDNDVRLPDRSFLAKVRQSAARHPDCGAISFELLQGQWTEASPALAMSELAAMAERGLAPFPGRAYYDWLLWGGASVIRRQVFNTVGQFDSTFTYGGEELDMAYRCHEAGIRLLRDTGLWLVHARSPDMRPKTNVSQWLKNMVIAQARYVPLPDLVLFLGLQFVKSALDALRAGTLAAFGWAWLQVLRDWPAKVARQRRPVSRATMRRFYFLRLNQPEEFAAVEQARTTVFDFYFARLKRRTPELKQVQIRVAMVPGDK